MGADHSFYVKTIETHARAFLSLNISAIGAVYWQQNSDEITGKYTAGPQDIGQHFEVILYIFVPFLSQTSNFFREQQTGTSKTLPMNRFWCQIVIV